MQTPTRLTHRVLFTVLALILATTGFLAAGNWTPAPVHAQDKTLVWEHFDVDITVNTDGTFDVAEHQEIRFTRGSFTFGYRDIPVNNFDYIDNWALTDSQGNVYRPAARGEAPYTFTVADEGSRYVVRWYFPPIANAGERYTLSYTVHGGLRYYDGGDQVWWKAIYGNRSFPVLAGEVRVTVPAPATVQEYAAYINERDARGNAEATVSEDNRSVLFTLTSRLDAGEEFEVRVEFTDGVVDGVAQPWQQQADAAAAAREAEMQFRDRWGPIATLLFGLLGLLLLLGGPVGLYILWHRFGRDKPMEMVADYLPEPPDALAPGIAGVLLDESADMEDVLATLVDLARRKAVSITEEEEHGFFRSSTDFIYRRERDDVPLAPHEAELMQAVFGSRDEVKLSDLKNKFYKELPALKESMYDAAVEAGFFPRSPDATRGIYYGLGIAGIIGSVLVAIVMLVAFGDLTGAAILPGIGLGVTAIGMVILARYMPRKTDLGAETAARWQAFKNYLQNIDKYADLEAQKGIWDQWLPYAIAFGVDKQYIRKFEGVDAPAPGWYFPTPTMYGPWRPYYYGTPWTGPTQAGSGGGGLPNFGGGSGEGGGMGGGLSSASRGMGGSLTAMSAGFGAMLTSASSTFNSRPSSSSSGGGWSGGGFSGGGGFGGGGGGGGGGGFG